MTKSLLSAGLLLLILLPGCSKSHTPQPGLIGQWRLDDVVSVDPGWIVDYAAGVVIELRTDSTYTQRTPWGANFSGIYSTADSAAISFLYLRMTGDTTTYRYQMQLNGLKLSLTGKFAIEYYHKL